MPKYIFVTGGVISGLGKGLASASIGCILEGRGLRVNLIKIDPYLNLDPGTISPYQHGEVFVTDDGAETDLDLGHYERFTAARLTQANNWTAGRIFQRVIERERRGDYLGQTVQVIPHVTDEIKEAIRASGADLAKTDVVIVEIGGTAGDIESLPFLEAIRQMRLDEGAQNTLFIHLTLVPYIATSGELKTKPTQHSVKDLRSIGIQPDVLLCRADRPLPAALCEKIALFCSVPAEAVITAQDVDLIYSVPLVLERQGLDRLIIRRLGLESAAATVTDLDAWREFELRIKEPPNGSVKIAIVGKYIDLEDAYKSLREALTHAAADRGVCAELCWINAESLADERALMEQLGPMHALLVPGGFGARGVEEMIRAIGFAREFRLPFFGICLGLQLACIEYARSACKLEEAHSTEFAPHGPDPVIFKLRDLVGVEEMGGTMRLGSYPCRLATDSLASEAYAALEIQERHRHRYEFNPAYRPALERAGLCFTGISPDGRFVEIVELPRHIHPWFLACQFHPEFKSRPLAAHPLFTAFTAAAIRNRDLRAEPRAKTEQAPEEREPAAPVGAPLLTTGEDLFVTPLLAGLDGHKGDAEREPTTAVNNSWKGPTRARAYTGIVARVNESVRLPKEPGR